ncbi:uncharacterized protein LOC113274170 [Papaver somniferum]|uniref:uncharacterized protein LOC113274170 n=1 Tax=Papaver somniferum TaxID=3469 RepID=UPI000E6FD2C1|nr:uncharacterized protein LOC113274170 [Papaver somniferum]
MVLLSSQNNFLFSLEDAEFEVAKGDFNSYCRRLGHEHQHCIDMYLLNHQRLLPEDTPQIPFHPHLQALRPFIEQERDDAYYEEMIYNVDLDDPDPEWSDWGSNPFDSPASSEQNKSAISFFDGEGYQQ